MTPSPGLLLELAGNLDGRIILPGDADMVLAHKQHAARLPFVPPAALIRCASVEDVVRCVTALGRAHQRFSIRSGGHCFADRSNAGTVVLDLAELASVACVGDRAILGTGLAAGSAVTRLAAQGRAIPTGGCIGVAVGGYAMVGGFGYSGRRLGLLSDRVVRFEAVLADGRRVDVTETDHPDLFWALRGGGPLGFAVVTAIEVETARLVGGIACRAEWPIAAAVDVIDSWQRYAPHAPDHVNVELSLLASDALDEPAVIALHGGIADESGATEADVAALRSAFGPYGHAIATTPLPPQSFAEHLVGLRTASGTPAWQPSWPFERVGVQATRSQFRKTALDRSTIAALVHAFTADRREAEAREVELIPWGGAYARPGSPDNLVPRDATMLVRHTALGGSRCSASHQLAMRRWATASWATIAGVDIDRSYQGYLEPDRPVSDSTCFAEHLDRLLRIKGAYDPHGVLPAL